jgi:hypothetical protein
MGFTKRNIKLEEYLDAVGAKWLVLTDSDYKRIYSEINKYTLIAIKV